MSYHINLFDSPKERHIPSRPPISTHSPLIVEGEPQSYHPPPVKEEPQSYHLSPSASSREPPKPTLHKAGLNSLNISTDSGSFHSRNSQGNFQWHTTTSGSNLEQPAPVEGTLSPGDLFFHHNTTQGTTQVWLYSKGNKWEDITNLWADSELVVHPRIAERVLTRHANNTPNWILRSSVPSAHGHSSRSRSASARASGKAST
ncbi:hypothetical protein K438DRAFT_1776460 [Mycena galopus ATCC 62051]|nr:hypothetical protein K438DRAFT_1776460 [Mycena galopus ATCC 62051]